MVVKIKFVASKRIINPVRLSTAMMSRLMLLGKLVEHQLAIQWEIYDRFHF